MSINLTRPFIPWTQPPYREIAALFAQLGTEPIVSGPSKDIEARHEIALAARAVAEYKREQLTVKQRLFIDAYITNGFDEYQAALGAGYGEAEARRVAKALLAKEQIQEVIQLTLKLYRSEVAVRFSAVEAEISALAFSNIGEFVNDVGEAYDTLDPTHPRMRAVKKFVREPTRYGYKTTIELHDKLGALGKLLSIIQGEDRSPDGKEGKAKGGDTIVNVDTINIFPVPQGQFLPAPERTKHVPLVIDRGGKMIDITPNSQINSPAHQAGASTRTEAAVPVKASS